MVDKSATIRSPETAEAATPQTEVPEIIRPYELTEDESELLEELTGNEYSQALKLGAGRNAHIGLIHEEGVDELTVLGLEPSERFEVHRGNYSAIKGHDLIFYGRRGETSFEEEIEWSQGIADIFVRCDQGSPFLGVDIELIERNELEAIKEKRLDNFIENYLRLKPGLAYKIRVVDFRHDGYLGTANYYNPFSGKIAISPEGLQFDHTFFHEMAHLASAIFTSVSPFKEMSLNIKSDWMLRAGEVYVGDAWKDVSPDDDDPVNKRIFEDGLLSRYSKKDMYEDISELTAFVYTVPGYVGWVANESQRLWEKVEFLSYREFITEEQRADVLEGDYSYIESQWKEIAGNAQIGRDAALKLSDKELLKMGFFAPTAVADPREDILYYLGAVDYEPCWLRSAARDNAKIAAKIEYLYANRMITGKQSHFLTAEEMPGMPDLPYCAQPLCEYARGSFWKSVGCYLDLAAEQIQLINSLMMPL